MQVETKTKEKPKMKYNVVIQNSAENPLKAKSPRGKGEKN
jgi:hypothetical protein